MVKPGFSHFHMEKWHITIATRIPQNVDKSHVFLIPSMTKSLKKIS